MKVVTLTYSDTKFKTRDRVESQFEHYDQITETCRLQDENGKLIGVYVKNGFYDPKFLELLDQVKYTRAPRGSGLITEDRTFGYAPRDGVRNFCCRAASLVKEQPQHFELLKNLGVQLSNVLKKYDEPTYRRHMAYMDAVEPFYHMGAFTSGVINKMNQLRFHRDISNQKGCMSIMLTYKNQCKGGNLVLPEYKSVIQNANGSMFLFNGRENLHGVTPFEATGQNFHRYTVVFYTMRGMDKCLAPEQEREFFNKKLFSKQFKTQGK